MNQIVRAGGCCLLLPGMRQARGRFEHCPPSRHLYHKHALSGT
jgi:hypothetical protein